MMQTVAAEAVWDGRRFVGRTTFRREGDHLLPVDGTAGGASDLHLPGTLFPRLTDHHVHLGLTDPQALFAGGITHAVDLGWTPAVAVGWLADDLTRPSIEMAGPLLTAPGGYPVRSGWAPRTAARELGGEREAREAVRENITLGASRTKVALNTVAGETVDDRTLHSIVAESHAHGVPVTVHAEGEGQAARAIRAGADQFAHAPFSERLDDDLIGEAAARGMSWISTLDIHGWGRPTEAFFVALDNLARFARAGGRVLYGTDLGNGPLPLGVDARELEALAGAGLDADALVRAIAGAEPAAATARGAGAPRIGPRIAWVPGVPPTEAVERAHWLAAATGTTVASLLSADHLTLDPGRR